MMVEEKNSYTIPELSELLNIPQDKALDEIAEILDRMSEKERKQCITRTYVHEL